MKEVVNFFGNMFTSLWRLLDSLTFVYDSVRVSYGQLLVVFLIIGLTITVFWKGSRT